MKCMALLLAGLTVVACKRMEAPTAASTSSPRPTDSSKANEQDTPPRVEPPPTVTREMLLAAAKAVGSRSSPSTALQKTAALGKPEGVRRRSEGGVHFVHVVWNSDGCVLSVFAGDYGTGSGAMLLCSKGKNNWGEEVMENVYEVGTAVNPYPL